MALVMMVMLFLTQKRKQAPEVETEQGPVSARRSGRVKTCPK